MKHPSKSKPGKLWTPPKQKVGRPRKHFKIQFKQDGQLWELQQIPIDRLAAAKTIKNSVRVTDPPGLCCVDVAPCFECPLQGRIYPNGGDCMGVRLKDLTRAKFKIIL